MQKLRTLATADLFFPLCFLYFFTLHADLVGFDLGPCHLRINNVIALYLFLCIVLKRQVLHMEKALFWNFVVLGICCFLSFLFSEDSLRCATFLGWSCFTLFCYLLLPLMLVKVVGFERVVKIYFASFVVVGVYAAAQLLFSFVGLVDPLAPQKIGNLVRPSALAYEPSFYALYMTPFIMLLNFRYLDTQESKLWQILTINALYLISTSTSVFFAYLFFALLLLIALRKQVWKFLAALCLGGAAICVFLPQFANRYFLKFFAHGFWDHTSFSIRWAGIKNSWTIFCDSPLLGVGLGGVPTRLQRAYLESDTRFIFLEHEQRLAQGEPSLKVFEPTSAAMELLASLGVCGFLATACLLYLICRKAPRAWQVSTLVLLFVLQFNQGLLRTYVWVHLALCYASSMRASTSSAS